MTPRKKREVEVLSYRDIALAWSRRPNQPSIHPDQRQNGGKTSPPGWLLEMVTSFPDPDREYIPDGPTIQSFLLMLDLSDIALTMPPGAAPVAYGFSPTEMMAEIGLGPTPVPMADWRWTRTDGWEIAGESYE